MTGKEEISDLAKEVLSIESGAIDALIPRIGESFLRAVDMLFHCKGKVVVTGMGKSGLVGKKVASTFASTGTPAFFLHPAEGSHGDLGMVTRGDAVIGISNSGETEELISILPSLKRFDIKVIGMVGKMRSTLAEHCDVVLDVSVDREACPLGYVPTASTAAALAMGDALAMALLKKRGFTKDDFTLLHPGGSLGKRFPLTIENIMHQGDEIPCVCEEADFREVIREISAKRFGMTTVVDGKGTLKGVITDGDLRRLFERSEEPYTVRAKDCMTTDPKLIERDALAAKAGMMLEHYSITSLIIVDQDHRPVGIIHLHDLLRAGVL
jgi:arabinose-5-phosphate isomerase